MTLVRAPFVLSAALAAALVLPLSAHADAAPAQAEAPIKLVVGALLTGTITSDNPSTVANPDGSSATGNFSGRYELLAGAEVPIDPNGLKVRLTAGAHVGHMTASAGGSERFLRLPLEATLWYPANPRLRLGAGVRYAMHPRFSGPGGNTNDSVNSTPSLIGAFEYQLLPNLAVHARYVYERYEQASGNDIEGSHFGIGLMASY